jgi:2-(1,2-epoxy-1,2-dihydrophenyl)acetyl-CoA isomerase
MYNFLKFETDNGTATVILNRPEVFNALNDEITYELQDVLKQIAKDPEARVVVLTGEGKAFCSGQDLKASSGREKRSFKESLHKRYNPIISAIRNMPKPVICRLNGVAAGAGCSLALACDIIIAADDAVLIEVFINIGLVLDSGSSYFLPKLISYSQAFEMSTMGSKINGRKAAEMGLVNYSVPMAELDAKVKVFTDFYSKAPTKAVGIIKKQLNKSYTSSMDEMLEYEALTQEIAGSSNDYKEGVTAFLEKRKPDFKGN